MAIVPSRGRFDICRSKGANTEAEERSGDCFHSVDRGRNVDDMALLASKQAGTYGLGRHCSFVFLMLNNKSYVNP